MRIKTTFIYLTIALLSVELYASDGCEKILKNLLVKNTVPQSIQFKFHVYNLDIVRKFFPAKKVETITNSIFTYKSKHTRGYGAGTLLSLDNKAYMFTAGHVEKVDLKNLPPLISKETAIENTLFHGLPDSVLKNLEPITGVPAKKIPLAWIVDDYTNLANDVSVSFLPSYKQQTPAISDITKLQKSNPLKFSRDISIGKDIAILGSPGGGMPRISVGKIINPNEHVLKKTPGDGISDFNPDIEFAINARGVGGISGSMVFDSNGDIIGVALVAGRSADNKTLRTTDNVSSDEFIRVLKIEEFIKRVHHVMERADQTRETNTNYFNPTADEFLNAALENFVD